MEEGFNDCWVLLVASLFKRLGVLLRWSYIEAENIWGAIGPPALPALLSIFILRPKLIF